MSNAELAPSKNEYSGPGCNLAISNTLAGLDDMFRIWAEIAREWPKQQDFLQEAVRRLDEMGRAFRAWIEFTQSPEFGEAMRAAAKRDFGTAFGEAYLEAYEHLAKKSWFLDAGIPMSAPVQIVEWLDQGKEDVIDNALADYYRGRIPEIEQSLALAYPTRKDVLASAFRAHCNKDYNLAIPVFLAQADGLSYEIYQSHFFRSAQSIPAAIAFIKQQNVEVYVAAYAYPLTHQGVIRQSTAQLPAISNSLNRHAIVHGISSDYGNEMNSLKCISLLSYLHGITEMINSEKESA
jgi:hypothetical protein